MVANIARKSAEPRKPAVVDGDTDGGEQHCSQPATSYLSPSARYAPVNGLAGCYVSTIGKPHEYFDLTGWPCSCSESAHVFRERRLVVQAYAVGSSKSNIV